MPVLAALAVVVAVASGRQVGGEVIAGVQVHGNVMTEEADILKMSGVAVGQPFAAATIEDVAARLRRTGRFRRIDVLKRFASIADPSQIVVVIIVDEGPVRLEVPDDESEPIRVVGRGRLTNLMVLPILSAEDGFGVTGGARLAYAGVGGRTARLSVPVTLGGERLAGVEYDRPFSQGPVTRLQVGADLRRVRNPAFEQHDHRRRVWARLDRVFGPVRTGAGADWQRVVFAGAEARVRSTTVDVTLDTRADPSFPRDAVLASVVWTRLVVRSAPAVHTRRWEAHGYVGLVGQTVLALRAVGQDATGPLPPAFQPLLGGSSSLRGFRAGTAVGDNLAAGRIEVLVPLTSPLGIGRMGVSVFADAGTVYPHDARLRHQRFRSGAGGGVWLTATAFRMGVWIARGRHAGTRVHFTAGVGR
jgi:outer membrane protein assembly factor BamA